METVQVPLDADLVAVLEDIGRPPQMSADELRQDIEQAKSV